MTDKFTDYEARERIVKLEVMLATVTSDVHTMITNFDRFSVEHIKMDIKDHKEFNAKIDKVSGFQTKLIYVTTGVVATLAIGFTILKFVLPLLN